MNAFALQLFLSLTVFTQKSFVADFL